MLVRSSGQIDDELYLLTLGHTCHYLLGNSDEFVLFDPGLSAHFPMLLKRIESLGFPIQALSKVCLTHTHGDRIGNVPLLRQLNPQIEIIASPALRTKLANPDTLRTIFDSDLALSKHFSEMREAPKLSFEEFSKLLSVTRVINDSDVIRLKSGKEVRAIAFPGHTEESVAYQILPVQYVLVDEGIGYYRGRELAAPGGDWDQAQALASMRKISKIAISGLCFPEGGVLTGQLIRKHVEALEQNSADLFSECTRAHLNGIGDEEIRKSVRDGFYTSTAPDPVLQDNLEKSFEGLWRQVLARRNETDTKGL